MSKRAKKTNMQEVRPFCLFMLTGGLITGGLTLGDGHLWLSLIIGGGGCVGALVAGGTAKVLDWIEDFDYKKAPRNTIGSPDVTDSKTKRSE